MIFSKFLKCTFSTQKYFFLLFTKNATTLSGVLISVLKLGPDRPVEPRTGQVSGPNHGKKSEIESSVKAGQKPDLTGFDREKIDFSGSIGIFF